MDEWTNLKTCMLNEEARHNNKYGVILSIWIFKKDK